MAPRSRIGDFRDVRANGTIRVLFIWMIATGCVAERDPNHGKQSTKDRPFAADRSSLTCQLARGARASGAAGFGGRADGDGTWKVASCPTRLAVSWTQLTIAYHRQGRAAVLPERLQGGTGLVEYVPKAIHSPSNGGPHLSVRGRADVGSLAGSSSPRICRTRAPGSADCGDWRAFGSQGTGAEEGREAVPEEEWGEGWAGNRVLRADARDRSPCRLLRQHGNPPVARHRQARADRQSQPAPARHAKFGVVFYNLQATVFTNPENQKGMMAATTQTRSGSARSSGRSSPTVGPIT